MFPWRAHVETVDFPAMNGGSFNVTWWFIQPVKRVTWGMVYLWVHTVPQIYIIIICKKFKHANIFCSLGGTPSFLELHPLSLQTAVHPAPCASQRAIWRGHHSPRRVGPARNLYPCRCLNVGGKHGTWVSFPLVLGHLHGENDDFYIFLPWDFDIYACSDPHQDTHLGFLRIFGWSILRAWPWVPWCPWCRCLSLAPRPP